MGALALKTINHFFLTEPVWRAVEQWRSGEVPECELNWLLEPNSLTQRIKNTFQAPFSVSVEGEQWANPFLADAECLKQPADCSALIREVLLKVGGQAYVFARTTLPKEVADELQELTRLGNKPLGEVIFSYPDLRRIRLDLATINVAQLSKAMQAKLVGQTAIWGRRNSYQINQQTFIVSEFFLPALYAT
ncbi:MAG: chorismate lyase [Cycloclasticus sp.]